MLLLESGGRKEDDAFQQLNRSDSVGQPLKSVHAGRFRALGGTTIRWGGQIQEMQEWDFEEAPWNCGERMADCEAGADAVLRASARR